MGCTVGFRAILDESPAFTTLNENLRMPFIPARAHLTPCIACEKARVN